MARTSFRLVLPSADPVANEAVLDWKRENLILKQNKYIFNPAHKTNKCDGLEFKKGSE